MKRSLDWYRHRILKNLGYDDPDRKYYGGPLEEPNPDYLFTASQIEEYYSNPDYMLAFYVWSRFHNNMGFPFTGAWAEQPKWVSDMIALFEESYNQEMAHKREQDTGSGNKGASKKSNYEYKTLST